MCGTARPNRQLARSCPVHHASNQASNPHYQIWSLCLLLRKWEHPGRWNIANIVGSNPPWDRSLSVSGPPRLKEHRAICRPSSNLQQPAGCDVLPLKTDGSLERCADQRGPLDDAPRPWDQQHQQQEQQQQQQQHPTRVLTQSRNVIQDLHVLPGVSQMPGARVGFVR